VQPAVSVVVPVYRNESTLAELHQRLRRAMGAHADACEYIYVNDASPDRSFARLLALKRSDPAIRIVRLNQNRGQSLALLRGLEVARGAVIALLDADLQDPPESVPSLLAALAADQKLDVVFGGRRGQYEDRLRLLSSWLHKRLLYLLSRRRLPADAGLFLVMRAAVRDRLLRQPYGDGSYLLSAIAATDARCISVPVLRQSNREGTSGYTPRTRIAVGLRSLRAMLQLRKTRRSV